MADEIIAARVRELLHYDCDTGIFTRTVRLARRHRVGARADLLINGGSCSGYRRVSIDSKRYLAHRVAWLYVYGKWPTGEIDHINGNRADNKISNLRDADHSVNMQNVLSTRKHNKSGFLGVYKDKNRWRAGVMLNGKHHHIGSYDSPEKAHEAYLGAKRILHKGCTI